MSGKSQVKQVANSYLTSGLDVSHLQGDLDWQSLYGQGYRFVFCKATEGQSFVDPKFYLNYNKAKDAGFLTGAYCFFHPSQSVSQQYHLFMHTVGPLRHGDLSPVLDLEITNNLAPDIIKDQAKKWLMLVESETGVRPIIYSNLQTLNYLGDMTGFGYWPLWLAHPGSEPKAPAPWNKWTFWQAEFGEKSIRGFDLDYFNGSLEDLKGLTTS